MNLLNTLFQQNKELLKNFKLISVERNDAQSKVKHNPNTNANIF